MSQFDRRVVLEEFYTLLLEKCLSDETYLRKMIKLGFSLNMNEGLY